MKLWLIGYGFVWVLLPVLGLGSLPESVDNAIENYLGKLIRFRNNFHGLTDPEMYMDVPELVRSRGYPIEVHEVFTEDGYGLNLHRIAGKRNVGTSHLRPVVYFQHGIWQSSACWLLNPVDKALPYVLADQGYDVWLGNLRGTTYSRKHVNYTITDDNYWDFAWDEMAKYDLPAMLKFVLAYTSQKDLTYVGHSLGCAIFFGMADIHPELQPAVNLMVALAPASVLPNMRTPIRYLAPFVTQLEYLFKSLGTNEFLPNTNLVRFLGQTFCTKGKIKPRKCENFAFILTGSDPANFNHSLVPLISKHSPAGTSVRTVAQFAQGVNSKIFQRYDWGQVENRVRYGQDTPPAYSLENVKVPVAIFYSDNDLLVVPEDATTLARRLGNLKGFHRVSMPEFNHMDFLLALRVDVLLNNDVRKLIETYNPSPTL